LALLINYAPVKASKYLVVMAPRIEMTIADSQLKVAVSNGNSEIFETFCSNIWNAYTSTNDPTWTRRMCCMGLFRGL